MANTYTATDRAEFANILRTYRAAGAIRAYGRLGGFGRSIITTNNLCIVYTAWTSRPPMNIHRGR
jgi:hypothetical protein